MIGITPFSQNYGSCKHFLLLTTFVVVCLLFTGCTTMNSPTVKPMDSQVEFTQEERDRIVATCKSEAERSLGEKWQRVNNSREDGKELGGDVGYIHDDITGSEKGIGLQKGERYGGLFGFLVGLFGETQLDSAQKKNVRQCLEARGLEVTSWS